MNLPCPHRQLSGPADFRNPVKKLGFFVIPAKAGIQFFPPIISSLDSGFHRSDDFFETIKVKIPKEEEIDDHGK
jgi:hypothetical protein